MNHRLRAPVIVRALAAMSCCPLCARLLVGSGGWQSRPTQPSGCDQLHPPVGRSAEARRIPVRLELAQDAKVDVTFR